mmetsp:Transcript_83910/g.140036  ORF Transcript_83910/g.140036 Transcript_83910/m.140036 type:complete len:315 (-) Transcript_83910:369-1313(-)
MNLLYHANRRMVGPSSFIMEFIFVFQLHEQSLSTDLVPVHRGNRSGGMTWFRVTDEAKSLALARHAVRKHHGTHDRTELRECPAQLVLPPLERETEDEEIRAGGARRLLLGRGHGWGGGRRERPKASEVRRVRGRQLVRVRPGGCRSRRGRCSELLQVRLEPDILLLLQLLLVRLLRRFRLGSSSVSHRQRIRGTGHLVLAVQPLDGSIALVTAFEANEPRALTLAGPLVQHRHLHRGTVGLKHGANVLFCRTVRNHSDEQLWLAQRRDLTVSVLHLHECLHWRHDSFAIQTLNGGIGFLGAAELHERCSFSAS